MSSAVLERSYSRLFCTAAALNSVRYNIYRYALHFPRFFLTHPKSSHAATSYFPRTSCRRAAYWFGTTVCHQFTHLLLHPGSLPARGYESWDEGESQETPPLGVKLTGYRLLNVGVILVFGVIQVALAHCGQSFALTTLDWVAVASLAVMYGLPKLLFMVS